LKRTSGVTTAASSDPQVRTLCRAALARSLAVSLAVSHINHPHTHASHDHTVAPLSCMFATSVPQILACHSDLGCVRKSCTHSLARQRRWRRKRWVASALATAPDELDVTRSCEEPHDTAYPACMHACIFAPIHPTPGLDRATHFVTCRNTCIRLSSLRRIKELYRLSYDTPTPARQRAPRRLCTLMVSECHSSMPMTAAAQRRPHLHPSVVFTASHLSNLAENSNDVTISHTLPARTHIHRAAVAAAADKWWQVDTVSHAVGARCRGRGGSGGERVGKLERADRWRGGSRSFLRGHLPLGKQRRLRGWRRRIDCKPLRLWNGLR
jgi:hypothetical protein